MATTATTLPASRTSGSRRALMIALAFGAISAFLVFAFLNRSDSGGGGATLPVLVAAQDVALGQELTDQNVTLKALPAVAKHPNAFTDKTESSALHQVATVPIAAGEQVLSSQLTKSQAEVGLAALIPEGHRAIAITVTEVAAGGGFIKPGDSVDVVGEFQANTTAPASAVLALPKGDASNKVYVAATVLQNVKVLAMGQSAQVPQQSTSSTPDNLTPSKEAASVKSVTLALTPDEVQKVFLAEEIGTLRLAGRRLGDTGSAVVGPQDNSLSGLLAK
ncbi:MAG TPA: Flp pilus assembly protein CpaB [Dehalococcoidia bacterium]|nr:Flp pilus assembly protein CpaB [Dehalococcoidia bacterium]